MARTVTGGALVALALSGLFFFGAWQALLAPSSPDGEIMEFSWLLLRILVLSVVVFETGVLLATLPFPVAVAACFLVWTGGAVLLRVCPVRLFRMALRRDPVSDVEKSD